MLADSGDNGPDVIRCGTATATDNIQETIGGPVTQLGSNLLRCLIVFTKLVGQSGIRMGRNVCIRNARQFLYILS